MSAAYEISIRRDNKEIMLFEIDADGALEIARSLIDANEGAAFERRAAIDNKRGVPVGDRRFTANGEKKRNQQAKPKVRCEECKTTGPRHYHNCSQFVKPSSAPPKETEILSDEYYVLKIREEWAEEKRPSSDVCKELGISLGKFNFLVQRHNIQQV